MFAERTPVAESASVVSYDLCVFHAASPLTDDDAGERYQALVGVDGISLDELSPAVAAFLADLKVRYPDIDEVPESEVADNPWSGGFDVSRDHVAMTIRPACAPEVGHFVEELAKRHALVCFDPQEGAIVTAPPGIRVSEREAQPVDAKGERGRPEWPFVEALDSALKPAGYVRRGRLWRKVGDTAIIAMRLWDEAWGYSVWTAVWLRSRGEIDPLEVKPGERGKWHFHVRLSGETLPPPVILKFYRAFHTGLDYAQRPLSGQYSDSMQHEIIRAIEPDVPLTVEWRQAAITTVFKNSVLPMLGRIESGEVTDPDELAWRRPTIERWALECRRRRDEGADDDLLIDWLFNELGEDDRGPGMVYWILEFAFGPKARKLADRIDEKWERHLAERAS